MIPSRGLAALIVAILCASVFAADPLPSSPSPSTSTSPTTLPWHSLRSPSSPGQFTPGQTVSCVYVQVGARFFLLFSSLHEPNFSSLSPTAKNLTRFSLPGTFSCDGVLFENAEEERDNVGSPGFYRDVAVCSSLFLIGALSSGLMSGLMSTPLIRLQILERGGTQEEQKYASALIAIVKRHHWLLVSMLLSITCCMQALPTFFAKLVGDPYLTIGITIPSILVFVQIIPQATCQRWSLQIGYFMSWFVWLLMVITSPVSWPISKMLDFTVGDNDSVFLGRKEIKEAIRINAEAEADGEEAAPLDDEQVKIIQGAINFRDKHVRDKFVPIDKVFMISDRAVLGPELFTDIKEIGHSRIPVYHNTRDMIIGILIVFDILNLSPNDRKPVDDLELLEIPRVSADLPLHRILSNFKAGGHQMAVVLDPVSKLTPIGIITLEDVLEVLIDSDLQDEKEFQRMKKMESGVMQSGELARSTPTVQIDIDISDSRGHVHLSKGQGQGHSHSQGHSHAHTSVKELLHQPGSFTLRHGAHGELEIARSPHVTDDSATAFLDHHGASSSRSVTDSSQRHRSLPHEQTLIDVNNLRGHPAQRLGGHNAGSSPHDSGSEEDDLLTKRR